MKTFMLWLIKVYQRYLSPLKGKNTCRFYPTCSAYAYQAIKIHGPLKGFFLAVKRILKCHPFNNGGYDPVPREGE